MRSTDSLQRGEEGIDPRPSVDEISPPRQHENDVGDAARGGGKRGRRRLAVGDVVSWKDTPGSRDAGSDLDSRKLVVGLGSRCGSEERGGACLPPLGGEERRSSVVEGGEGGGERERRLRGGGRGQLVDWGGGA
jgi:hypothetical protein